MLESHVTAPAGTADVLIEAAVLRNQHGEETNTFLCGSDIVVEIATRPARASKAPVLGGRPQPTRSLFFANTRSDSQRPEAIEGRLASSASLRELD